jgi:hypothetical protein
MAVYQRDMTMKKNSLIKTAIGYAIGLLAIAAVSYAGTGTPTPAVGLYWLLNGDPTISPGANAPLNQLGIRTDTPSLYYKSGAANTAWTSLSGGGGGGGTVTSITCGAGLTCTPNPIVATGTIAASGGVISGLTAGIIPVAASSTSLQDGSISDDSATATLSGEAWTSCSDASTGIATVTAPAACTELDLTGASQIDLVGITHPSTAHRHILIVNHTGAEALIYFENTNAAAADQIGGDFGSPWPLANGNSLRVDYDQNPSFEKWIPNFSSDVGPTIVSGQLSGTGNLTFINGQAKLGNLNTSVLPAAAISGTVDDWTPAGWTSAQFTRIEVAPSSGAILTGLAAINPGAFATICNTSATNNLQINDNNTGGSSSPGNFFYNGNPFAITLIAHSGIDPECATYQYATAVSGWNLVATTASQLGSLTLGSGLAVLSSGITTNSLSVASGNSQIDNSGNALYNSTSHIVSDGSAATLTCNGTGSVTCSTSNCTDIAGTLAISTGATSCTVTFAGTYGTSPTCIVSAGSSAIAPIYISSRSDAAITITSSGTLPALIDYECVGH